MNRKNEVKYLTKTASVWQHIMSPLIYSVVLYLEQFTKLRKNRHILQVIQLILCQNEKKTL